MYRTTTATTVRMSYIRDGIIYIGSDDTTQVSTSASQFGLIHWGDTIRICTQRTPATSSAAGYPGEICHDSSYLYVCTAANTWKRVPLDTF